MVLRASLLTFLVIGLIACASKSPESETSSEVKQEPMNTEDARNVYTLHCVSCHGIDGKKKASKAADLSKSIMTEAGIRRNILKGNKEGMMPYEQILSKREVEGLVKFVKTLRKK